MKIRIVKVKWVVAIPLPDSQNRIFGFLISHIQVTYQLNIQQVYV